MARVVTLGISIQDTRVGVNSVIIFFCSKSYNKTVLIKTINNAAYSLLLSILMSMAGLNKQIYLIIFIGIFFISAIDLFLIPM